MDVRLCNSPEGHSRTSDASGSTSGLPWLPTVLVLTILLGPSMLTFLYSTSPSATCDMVPQVDKVQNNREVLRFSELTFKCLARVEKHTIVLKKVSYKLVSTTQFRPEKKKNRPRLLV